VTPAAERERERERKIERKRERKREREREREREASNVVVRLCVPFAHSLYAYTAGIEQRERRNDSQLKLQSHSALNGVTLQLNKCIHG
jgi:hypothetical protein